jgi:hypothetical protein
MPPARSQCGAPSCRRSANLARVIHLDSIITMIPIFSKQLLKKVRAALKIRTP